MIPKIIFIIPYRNREQHKNFFLRYIKYILEDYNKNDYEIVFSHQKDTRPFNRGAVKNIGFKFIKKKYPDDYKNINFVFHDIDVMPSTKGLLDYETTQGTIKHYYGFKYALGGIISIKGSDFELMNGYPNYWSWSLEDNCLQKRADKNNINIDRSNFFSIGDYNILHIHDGFYKDYSETNLELFRSETGNEGLETIYKLIIEDKNITDDIINHTFCDIINFDTLYSHIEQLPIEKHNLKDGNNLNTKKKQKLRMNNRISMLMYSK
jgi:hypothetical protein